MNTFFTMAEITDFSPKLCVKMKLNHVDNSLLKMWSFLSTLYSIYINMSPININRKWCHFSKNLDVDLPLVEIIKQSRTLFMNNP